MSEQTNRKDYLEKLIANLGSQLSEARKELDKLNYNDNTEYLQQYVGRCYLSKETHEDAVRCIMFTKVLAEPDNYNPNIQFIDVHYLKDANEWFVLIQNDILGSYSFLEDSFEKNYQEISKEEFMGYYNTACMKFFNV